MLFNILIATLAISLVSLVGIIISYNKIKKYLHYFVSFAAGTLVAVSLFDLIPEALEELSQIHVEDAFVFVAAGIVFFFLIERFIHWHHCDKDHCEAKPEGVLILTGDFVHNFLDGILIAGAFMLDFVTGVATTMTVAIHEIPQEFGDFAVLINSGFSKRKALFLNFASALSAVLGGVLGFFFFNRINNFAPFAVLVAAGGFLYVALSDIIPGLHSTEKNRRIVVIETAIFVLTIVGTYFLIAATHV